MGIKDNFSQAVKELWKKDDLAGEPEKTDGQSDLNRYLRDEPEKAQEPTEENVALETPYYRNEAAPEQQSAQTPPPVQQSAPQQNSARQTPPPQDYTGYQDNARQSAQPEQNQYAGNTYRQAPPPVQRPAYAEDEGISDGEEITVISRNTIIDGNVRSLANMQVDGNVKGNIETTKNVDISGKVVGDLTCNNVNMRASAMQGNIKLKGKMRMDRDTILIGDLTSTYADINGRIRGKLEIAGKAELKRDAVIFGDINTSTIAVTDGAIIQGYVNTTFLSKDDSAKIFPENISLDNKN